MSLFGLLQHRLPGLSKTLLNNAVVQNYTPYSRNFSVTHFIFKKNVDSIDPEASVILLGNKDKQTKMKYSELLEKVGQRKLVKVHISKKTESDLPLFKIMSDVDLEIAARKARAESAYLGSKTMYETDSGRLKQKQLELKTKMSDHDLSFKISSVIKWLKKGHFVRVDIKIAKGGTKADAEALKKKIEDEMADHQELLGQNNSKLIVNLK